MLQKAVRLDPRYLLMGEILVALAFAFFHLAHKSYWRDEGLTVAFIEMDWKSMWELFARREANMVGYFVVVDGWREFGGSEFFLRSLSALFAVASIPVTYFLASRLFSRKVGLIAGLLMVTNAFWLEHAQEARAYSMTLLLSGAATYTFVAAMERRSSLRLWVAYSVLAALTTYSHMFGGWMVVAQVTSLAFLPSSRVPWREVGGSLLLAAILVLPLVAFVLSASGQLDWVPELTLIGAAKPFVTLAGGVESAPVYFIACVLGSLAALRVWLVNGRRFSTWSYALVLAMLLVPISAGILISIYKPVLVPRFFVVSLMPLVLLASVGLAQIKNPYALGGALVVATAVSLFAVISYYAEDAKEDWRGATHFILSASQERDAILFFTSNGQIAYEFYADRTDSASPHPTIHDYTFVALPEKTPPDPLARDVNERTPPDPELGERLAPDYDRVWLVLSHNKDSGSIGTRTSDTVDIINSLSRDFARQEEHHFTGVDIILFASP